MVKLVNRAKMSTATTGTGTITLGSAESGYQSFADAGVGDGETVRYVIEDGTEWEIGTGTYTASGTTLSRTVSESTNSDAAISLSGSAVVFVSATPADIATAAQGAKADTAQQPPAEGPFVDGDKTKLDGIETGATADQTGAEIKAAYEGEANTNAYTDAEKSKLAGIEAGANVTDTANVSAAGALMDSELTDIAAVKALDQGVATTDNPTFAGLTTTANVSFGDNDKAIFGIGNDLQIYHDGSNSYIDDVGTGSLFIRATNLNLQSAGGSDTYLTAAVDGAVAIRYDGSEKLVTTSTGVDVTGDISVSGTVDGRDVAADGTKLDGIEAGADVTDTANVTAAGALMDSEVTNLVQVKAFNSADYATAAQGTTADNALARSGGTMTGNLTFDEVTETVYNLTGTVIDPANGSIQLHTLTGNTTYTDAFSAGQAITLMVDDGTSYTITWPTMTWVNNGGSAPTLATSGYTVIALWKVSTTLYGALVGDGS